MTAPDLSYWEIEIWQEDQMVASVSSGVRLTVLQEAAHYAAVYSQDGPVEVMEVYRAPLNLEREIEYARRAQDGKAGEAP
jgi:hypothetical protein